MTVNEGVSKMMCQLLKLESAPDIDINFFTGNPMSFHYFMDVFNEIQQWRRKWTVKREPDLTDFIHVVDDLTLTVSDRIFSKKAIEQYINKKPNKRRTKVSSCATKHVGKLDDEEKSADWIYYSKDHKFYRWNAFMNQTLEERIRFFARKKICCGCLQPIGDRHNATSWKRRLSCVTCEEKQPTYNTTWLHP